VGERAPGIGAAAPSTEPPEVKRAGQPPPESGNGRRPPRTSRLRIGDIVREMGLATEEQISGALARQRETRQRLGQVLVDMGIVESLDLTRALAAKFGVEVIDLTTASIDPVAANLVPERACRRYGLVPVRYLDENTLLVAMADPANVFAIDDLRIMTGLEIQPAIASEEDILGVVSRLSRLDETVEESPQDPGADLADEDMSDIREATEAAPIVKLVNSVIAQAVDDEASDIQFLGLRLEMDVRGLGHRPGRRRRGL